MLRFWRWTKDWCITASDVAFEQYTCAGEKSVYLLVRDDYRTVPKKPTENFPTDSYGLSICCLIVNADGSIDLMTNRWNAPDEDPLALERFFAALFPSLEECIREKLIVRK